MKNDGPARKPDGTLPRRARRHASGVQLRSPGARGARRALLVAPSDPPPALSSLLSRNGFDVEHRSGASSLAGIAARYALVVLAGALAPDDMARICSQASDAAPRPVVVAVVEPAQLPDAIAAGPDEILLERSPEELMKWRLQKQLGGCKLALVPERRVLWVQGADVPLRPHEYRLMELLFQRCRQRVTHHEIIAYVWENRTTSMNTLYSCVSHLRDKMGPLHGCLRAEPGGYCLYV